MEPRFQKGARWKHRNLGHIVHIVSVSEMGHFYLSYAEFTTGGGLSPNLALNSCVWTCKDLDREFKSLTVLPWHERLDDSIEEISDNVLAEKAREARLELAAHGDVEGAEESCGIPPVPSATYVEVDVGDAPVFPVEMLDV